MKHWIILTIFLTACFFGCLGSQQTATQTIETSPSLDEDESVNALAVLELSTQKTTYAAQEAIPLELQIKNGKFDILVPFSSVAMLKAFKQLTVSDSNGVVVNKTKMIPLGNTMKTLYKDGKSIRCIQGFDMKAGTAQTVVMDNLLAYYNLEPGSYTAKVTIELEVYNESMPDQHPQIIELEKEIADIQKNPSPQYTPEAKKEATGYIQDQIKLIQEKYKEDLQNIYLPTKSRRGKALLESNTISITIT